ncbi:hypothetical protein D3C76_338480 [compost metagenome]|uniref:Uncharacterized protein n=1 Tax=Pseudomonas putida TaxID=303 RepID=A0A7D5VZV7_PSEPU|nr:hypothetical protein [Pseudomonas putida]QLJ15090.1 hypothetical protein H0H12_03845 [Pseudomonas putida]
MTDKIKITGVPPKWDQSEYEKRVDAWVNVYRQTERSMELVQAPFGHEFLQRVIDKANAGYTVTPKKDVKHSPLDYSVWMVKPLEQQQADIAEIRKDVKAEYVAHLESERERYQQLLRQQLIQAQEEKDRKAAEQAKAKQMAEIEKEVQACYKPLEIPE